MTDKSGGKKNEKMEQKEDDFKNITCHRVKSTPAQTLLFVFKIWPSRELNRRSILCSQINHAWVFVHFESNGLSAD